MKRRGPGGIRFEDLDDADPTVVELSLVAKEARPEELPPGVHVRLEPTPRPRPNARGPLLRLTFDDPARLRELCTRHLGRGAFFLRFARPLPLGTEVELELTAVEYRDPVVLAGRVVHVTPPGAAEPGMGVQLADVSRRERAEIARYLGVPLPDDVLGSAGGAQAVRLACRSRAEARALLARHRHEPLFIPAAEVPPPGTAVTVVLEAPDLARPLELRGVVEDARRGHGLRVRLDYSKR